MGDITKLDISFYAPRRKINTYEFKTNARDIRCERATDERHLYAVVARGESVRRRRTHKGDLELWEGHRRLYEWGKQSHKRSMRKALCSALVLPEY